MAGFYQVYLKPNKLNRVLYRPLVEKALGKAFDWFRVTPNMWYICTSQDANEWFSRLQKYAKPEGYLLVIKLDIDDRQGWMSRSFWDWLKKNRARLG